MNPVNVVIKRHWYGLRRQLLPWFVFLILIPILLYMVLGLSFYKIIMNVSQLNYLHWVAPGIWISSAFLMSYVTAFITTNHIRRSNNLLTIYLKAPISCWSWLSAQTVWAMIIGTIQLIFALVLVGFINGEVYSVFKWLTLLAIIYPAVIFGAVLGTVTGSWVIKPLTSMLLNLVIIITFLSCTGSFIPLSYFPQSLQTGLMFIPVIREVNAAQHLILYSEIRFSGAVLTLIISACLFVINGATVQRWIRR